MSELSIERTAAQVRQATQGCTSHLAGPVLAYFRARDEWGEDMLPTIGYNVIDRCRARITQLGEMDGDHSREINREQQVIDFTRALYCEER